MEKRDKKKRRIFNLYNLAVLLCLVMIIGSVLVLFEMHSEKLPKEWTEKYAEIRGKIVGKFEEWTSGESKKENITTANETKSQVNNTASIDNKSEENEISNGNVNSNEGTNTGINVKPGDANETAAKTIAIAKFRELGETDVLESDIQIMKIQRESEDYYYITSKRNSIEIHITTGKITRVNSIPVE